MTNKYRIETVADFLRLDEDQFARAIVDFYASFYKYKDMVKAHPEAEGQVPAFIWVDDGEHDFLGLVADEK